MLHFRELLKPFDEIIFSKLISCWRFPTFPFFCKKKIKSLRKKEFVRKDIFPSRISNKCQVYFETSIPLRSLKGLGWRGKKGFARENSHDQYWSRVSRDSGANPKELLVYFSLPLTPFLSKYTILRTLAWLFLANKASFLCRYPRNVWKTFSPFLSTSSYPIAFLPPLFLRLLREKRFPRDFQLDGRFE